MGVSYSIGTAATYKKIATQTLGGNNATVTFSNIPQTFTDLVISVNGSFTAGNSVALQFNGDTGSNYSSTIMQGSGSAATSARFTSQTNVFGFNFYTTFNGVGIIQVMNYSNPNVYKTFLFKGGTSDNYVYGSVGLWRSISPINQISFTGGGTYTTGTSFTLYGIAAARQPKATGGDITSDGTYWYHTFKYTGTFEPLQALTADYLVVAGGGAGGVPQDAGQGGGGAGGFRTSIGSSTLSLTANAKYTCTVGAGGSYYNVQAGSIGRSGSDSTFATITSTGGGGGGSGPTGGGTGGSGGGGSHRTNGGAGNTPSTTPSQGNSGGNGAGTTPYFPGAGGGGAGASGNNSSGSGVGAAGGNGTYNAITDALQIGELSGGHYYLAGGGGGGSRTGGYSTAGLGYAGQGGGGTGVNGTDARTNSGSGGGGCPNTASKAGWGGSGIIVVRYAV